MKTTTTIHIYYIFENGTRKYDSCDFYESEAYTYTQFGI